MGANSKIEWTWTRVEIARIDSEAYRLALEIGAVQLDATTLLVPGYTFNPWIGCTKVDELCTHCYAAAQDAFRHWTPEGWGPREATAPHQRGKLEKGAHVERPGWRDGRSPARVLRVARRLAR
jgi:hypothetical protein